MENEIKKVKKTWKKVLDFKISFAYNQRRALNEQKARWTLKISDKVKKFEDFKKKSLDKKNWWYNIRNADDTSN